MSEEQNALKQALLDTVTALWKSDSFGLKDTDRTRSLRPDILRRLLSLVMTDDERAALLNLPEGCRVRESAKIIAPDKLVCGKYVWIGEGALVDASGGLEIGDHTSIAAGVMVWTHSSHLSNLAMRNDSGNALIQRKRTRIGHGCLIAGPSVVYAGVTIGDKCLVQPMSVVTKDVPSYSVVAGSPARVIRTHTEENIRRMVEESDSKIAS